MFEDDGSHLSNKGIAALARVVAFEINQRWEDQLVASYHRMALISKLE